MTTSSLTRLPLLLIVAAVTAAALFLAASPSTADAVQRSVFSRYQRRQAMVERKIRHVFLAAVSTRRSGDAGASGDPASR